MPLTLFFAEQGKITTSNTLDANSAGELLWCDLLNPTKEEEKALEAQLGLEIPTRDEMREIELSNRFYLENDAIYCTVNVATKLDSTEPEIHAITFILKGNMVVTLRYCEPYAFELYTHRLLDLDASHTTHGVAVVMGICEAIVNRLADVLESSNHALDALHSQLFRPSIQDKKMRKQSVPDYEELLREIGVQGNLLSKIHETLVSITRGLNFIKTTNVCPATSEPESKLNILLKDIAALNDHTRFLSGNKVAFLLDASLGLVGIQQTMIIKIFSVAAVVFLPPTLIASIYGMNFDVMPELNWRYGYPFAITLMLISAWLPYQFFKKKKWL